ncbi:hypothetical protein ACLOJK_002865 [Asimina triloba]
MSLSMVFEDQTVQVKGANWSKHHPDVTKHLPHPEEKRRSEMTDSMNPVKEQMRLFPDFYSGLYPHAREHGENEMKPRRRRKKSKGGGGDQDIGFKKRKLSAEQVSFLEMNFGNERKLESSRKLHLATELGLDPRQVAVWFQNRRARWRSKQLEEEYTKLKCAHEAVVIEKCQLEAEVLKLREQLSETEKEVRKLSADSVAATTAGASEGESGSPTSSSLSYNAPFLGEFMDSLPYIPENGCMTWLDWGNF